MWQDERFGGGGARPACRDPALSVGVRVGTGGGQWLVTPLPHHGTNSAQGIHQCLCMARICGICELNCISQSSLWLEILWAKEVPQKFGVNTCVTGGTCKEMFWSSKAERSRL